VQADRYRGREEAASHAFVPMRRGSNGPRLRQCIGGVDYSDGGHPFHTTHKLMPRKEVIVHTHMPVDRRSRASAVVSSCRGFGQRRSQGQT
jgi:hypothetical protein